MLQDLINYLVQQLNIPAFIAQGIANRVMQEVTNGTRDLAAIIADVPVEMVNGVSYSLMNVFTDRRTSMANAAIARLLREMDSGLHNNVVNMNYSAITQNELINYIADALNRTEIFPLSFVQEAQYVNAICDGLRASNPVRQQPRFGMPFFNTPQIMIDRNNFSRNIQDYLTLWSNRLRVEMYLKELVFRCGWRATSPLAYAVRENYIHDVNTLLAVGNNNVNDVIRDGSWAGWSILAYSVRDSRTEMARILLEKGANPNQVIEQGKWQGWSLLAYVVREEKIEIVRELLARGANINQTMPNGEWEGWSLLAFTVRDSRIELMRELLNSNVDPNQIITRGDWRGWSLLAYAVREQKIEIALELLEANGNKNLSQTLNQTMPNGNWKGWSLLAFAVYNHQIELANDLIGRGENINVQFPDGKWQGYSLRDYIAQKQLNINLPTIPAVHDNVRGAIQNR